MRLEDWEPRLDDVVKRWRTTPFAYGSADCCVFAGECVEAVTGENPWRAFAGYKTAKGGAGKLKKAGFRSLADVLQDLFGDPVPVAFAQRGDLVWHRGGFDQQLSVCLGTRSVRPGPEGLVVLETLSLQKAFRVG